MGQAEVENKRKAEALIPKFKFERVLNQGIPSLSPYMRGPSVSIDFCTDLATLRR
jgi:hypothetical protein